MYRSNIRIAAFVWYWINFSTRGCFVSTSNSFTLINRSSRYSIVFDDSVNTDKHFNTSPSVDHHDLGILRHHLLQLDTPDRRYLHREAEQIFRIGMQQKHVGDQLVAAELLFQLGRAKGKPLGKEFVEERNTHILQPRTVIPAQLRLYRALELSLQLLIVSDSIQREALHQPTLAQDCGTVFERNQMVEKHVRLLQDLVRGYPPLFFFGSESTAFFTCSSSWCGLCCLISTNTSATSDSMFECRQKTDAYSRFMMSASPCDASIDCTIGSRSFARSWRNRLQKNRITDMLASR
uniref:Uncharacterized protein n=1 Tax=Anopheles melas TaxID=34690 RepID=A0A182U1Y2_9DIPT